MSSNARQLAANLPREGGLSNRNKLINGAMVIDQRNGGASITPTGTAYTLDRWRLGASAASKVSVQQSSVAPEGFSNSALITSVSAYTIGAGEEINFGQRIEGYNTPDLGWGTASAKAVILSFWVRSSLTGLFSGAVKNADGTRSYAFTYSINAANTWEYKSVTIQGDTSGTWSATNSTGVIAQFMIAAGSSLLITANAWASGNYAGAVGATNLVATNGATLYFTGVQLEVGDTATPFEHRSYSDQLQACKRYYWRPKDEGHQEQWMAQGLDNAGGLQVAIQHPVTMRTTPSVTIPSPNNLYWEASPWTAVGATVTSLSVNIGHMGPDGGDMGLFQNNAVTRGQNYNIGNAYFAFDAEL